MALVGGRWQASENIGGLMAADGFTGAPAITVDADEVSHYWSTLGDVWKLMSQRFKPYAVCYWAQAPITGALRIQAQHNVSIDNMKRIQVRTFPDATHLTVRRPENTEEAQYSLPFPVAAALVHHRLGYAELSGDALHDPVVLQLAERIEMIGEKALNPTRPNARVIIETYEGATYDSGVLYPKWGLTNPPATDEELSQKYHEVANGIISAERAHQIEQALWHIEEMADVSELVDMLAPGLG